MHGSSHRRALGLATATLLLFGCVDGDGQQATSRPTVTPATRTAAPPAQPARGPGGSQRRHDRARRTELGGASGAVTIFEPAQPEPARAPVVVFTQGVGPAAYQGWIDHLVGRGSIVIFQDQPFRGISLRDRRAGTVAGLRAALWAAVGHLPAANRDYVRVRSDQRGPVALRADHLFPLSSADNPPDALDFFGPWKLLDGLQRCATLRRDCQFAMGGTERQRFMGRWSDGTAVAPLESRGPS
jgi:hypothetical protein